MRRIALALLVLSADAAPAANQGAELPLGPWRAWLDCPGGELPFGLELSGAGEGLVAHLRNGRETIEVPRATWDGTQLVLDIDHYDARIVARLTDGQLAGEWTKRRGSDRLSKLTFHATVGAQPRFERRERSHSPAPVGRFAVDFESDEDPAVGLFTVDADGTATGTFLTTLGDYRYLAGAWHGDVLELSCFDGAHAFLFRARPADNGGLAGDFWSSASWHETWTARRDPGAALPDPFAQVRWNDDQRVDDLTFPGLDGRPRSLAEWRHGPRIIQVFGTWCPNCCDESRYLAELDQRYAARGLSIIGVAFEHTGDVARDARQIERWRKRFGAEYPVLLGGLSDKRAATAAFGALDRIKSYPTTIFIDRAGGVRAVHSGFAGPATGSAHERLRERFETLIEELLAERDSE